MQVLGLIVEVALDGGLDLLAAYPDHTARFWNYSGKGVVWERPNGSLDGAIDAALGAASAIAVRIGPWREPRQPRPPKGQVHLNMLTPDGLCFGERPFQLLAKDATAGPLIAAAVALMQELTALK